MRYFVLVNLHLWKFLLHGPIQEILSNWLARQAQPTKRQPIPLQLRAMTLECAANLWLVSVFCRIDPRRARRQEGSNSRKYGCRIWEFSQNYEQFTSKFGPKRFQWSQSECVHLVYYNVREPIRRKWRHETNITLPVRRGGLSLIASTLWP